MKNYYRIHFISPISLTENTVKDIDSTLSRDLTGRIEVDKINDHVGSLILSVDDSGNPEYDELSDFILSMAETDCIVYFGYPKEDHSNAMTEECSLEVWKLLDSCEVNEPAN